MQKLYRYTDYLVSAGVDAWETPLGPAIVALSLQAYEVTKTTAKGVWISYGGEKKFVNLTANKRFALPTKEEAVISFKARKQRQIKLLTARLKNAREALARINEL